jgi:membrane protease YdiL (CAAX protease family)
MKDWVTGLVIIIPFTVLVIQFYNASKKGFNSTTDIVLKGGQLGVLNQRHLISLMVMLIAVVYGYLKNPDWLLLALPTTKALWLTIIAAVAACIVSTATARKALRNDMPVDSSTGPVGTYLFIRALFLIVYELFFRGLLLSFCLVFTSVPVAIAINVVLYAIAHAFSTRQELIGTVPFGILLCLLTLYTGSVWPAVVIHLLLGLPYDLLILTAPKHKTKMLLS